MKYKIIDKSTGKEAGVKSDHDISDQYILTKDGLIAWWDESAGWDIDDYQDSYEIIIISE